MARILEGDKQMKCWNCKKKDIKHAWRVPVITRGVEKFRDFCDNCYQKVKEAQELVRKSS